MPDCIAPFSESVMRAHIQTKQAKFTLERLHAELGGQIQENKAEGIRLAEAMRHVEAVLKILDPEYDVRPIAVRRRKPNPYFKRGTVFRAALDVLRKAERPLTALDITKAMLAAKGFQNVPDKAVRDLEGAVRSALRGHDGGAIISGGIPRKWRVKSVAS
jgi:hypothetical protein